MDLADDRYVLLVGDAHGNAAFVQTAIECAARQGITRILQLGDFGIWPGPEGIEYLSRVESQARRHRVRVDFLDGNHEDYTQLEAWREDNERAEDGSVIVRPHIHWWPRGSVAQWHGRRVGFLGGAVSVDRLSRWPYQSWWPQEEITADDLTALETNTTADGGTLDVLFTHDTTNFVHLPSRRAWPAEVLADATASRELIDTALVRLRPTLLVHGHWHMRYRATAEIPGHPPVRVEGLGAEDPDLALAILDLETLEISGRAATLEQLSARYG
jgi:hypothetical protein